MNIYLLYRYKVDYDEASAYVVVAKSSQQARKMCRKESMRDQDGVSWWEEWLSSETSKCTYLGKARKILSNHPAILHSHYDWG